MSACPRQGRKSSPSHAIGQPLKSRLAEQPESLASVPQSGWHTTCGGSPRLRGGVIVRPRRSRLASGGVGGMEDAPAHLSGPISSLSGRMRARRDAHPRFPRCPFRGLWGRFRTRLSPRGLSARNPPRRVRRACASARIPRGTAATSASSRRGRTAAGRAGSHAEPAVPEWSAGCG